MLPPIQSSGLRLRPTQDWNVEYGHSARAVTFIIRHRVEKSSSPFGGIRFRLFRPTVGDSR